MSRFLEVVLPSRLGSGFRWLLASSWVTNLGDGIALAAGPLLVASQTDSAFLVALAALVGWLPPLAFGLLAGALTDRLDRRLIVVSVNLVRCGVLALLVVAIGTGRVSIGLVLAALFCLGTAEVFVDNVAGTLPPMLVDRDDLAVANARLMTGFVGFNQLAGPPIGAALFVLGSAWPFAAHAVLVALGALLILRMSLPAHVRDRETLGHVGHEIVEGVRWVIGHAAVRTLVLTIFTFNLTYGAAWSVLVLYATEHLGMGPIGFGVVTTVIATGGLLGVLGYDWLTRRVSLGDLMRVGLVIETLTHLVLALTTSPYVALPAFFLFGAHAFVWGTTSQTIRQRAVPTGLQGRVNAVNTVATFGGLVIGAALGGGLAQQWGVLAPYWFAFVGSAGFVVLFWPQVRHIKHADDAADTGNGSAPRVV